MKPCVACGEEFEEKKKFCNRCGAQQECLDCGYSLKVEAHFCPECGVAILTREDQVIREAGFRKVPTFVWVIGAIAIAAIILQLFYSNTNVFQSLMTPEQTVKNFFNEFADGELEDASDYLHSDVKRDFMYGAEGFVPPNASVRIVDIQKEQSGDFATLDVMVNIYPEPYYEDNPVNVIAELERVSGKWLIYDMH
ncbi:double zinc ribbon domain-containing protein [Halobacillus mangrovi]|uniref:double zinc ribbon domain-containing protein n=1 Tax=Halobacillus mangrovi TaxID=402384 RepID=UPI003D970150